MHLSCSSSSPASPAPACELRLGTSGYAYTEWIDAGFYPPDTPTGRMLALYAQTFAAVELNHTWYQMPRADALERQRELAPPGFLFAVKLTRTLTHEIDPGSWQAQARAFRNGVAPLLQARQLAAVLVHLPLAFDYSPPNRRYLAGLLSSLDGLPLAVEFTHESWAIDKVFAELARRRVTLAAVDHPALPGLFPALDIVTQPELIYLRFHGRNVRGGRQQSDYDYSAQELREWAERRIAAMAGQARQGVVFFSNHVRGQAAKNARALGKILAGLGLQAR